MVIAPSRRPCRRELCRRLFGRVALVAGASSGLGLQLAEVLAAAGAGVVLAGRRVERAQGPARRGSRRPAATRTSSPSM